MESSESDDATSGSDDLLTYEPFSKEKKTRIKRLDTRNSNRSVRVVASNSDTSTDTCMDKTSTAKTGRESPMNSSAVDNSSSSHNSFDEDSLDDPYTQALEIDSDNEDGIAMLLRDTSNNKKKEPIRPGDVLEYHSNLFVAGDRRGLRLSTVLSVDPRRTPMLVLDNGEFLPDDTQVRRVQVRCGRKLRDHPGVYRPIDQFKLARRYGVGSSSGNAVVKGLKKESRRLNGIIQRNLSKFQSRSGADGFAPMDLLNYPTNSRRGDLSARAGKSNGDDDGSVVVDSVPRSNSRLDISSRSSASPQLHHLVSSKRHSIDSNGSNLRNNLSSSDVDYPSPNRGPKSNQTLKKDVRWIKTQDSFVSPLASPPSRKSSKMEPSSKRALFLSREENSKRMGRRSKYARQPRKGRQTEPSSDASSSTSSASVEAENACFPSKSSAILSFESSSSDVDVAFPDVPIPRQRTIHVGTKPVTSSRFRHQRKGKAIRTSSSEDESSSSPLPRRSARGKNSSERQGKRRKPKFYPYKPPLQTFTISRKK